MNIGKLCSDLIGAIRSLPDHSGRTVEHVKNSFTTIAENLKKNFKCLTGPHKSGRKPTREEIGVEYSKQFDGYKLETSATTVIDDKTVTIKSTCTPQHMLSGFGNGYDAKLYSSAYDSKDHISNLWQHDIEVSGGEDGNKKISFIRSGSTRGNSTATDELLLNAAIMQAGGKEEFDKKVSKGEPIKLNLSNIQLMTAGTIGTDMEIPLKQIEKLQGLAKGEQPIEIKFQDKTFKINLQPPLLFNFGTNVQQFKLKPLVDFKASDEINQASFKMLFGNFPSELGNHELCAKESILDKFFQNENKTSTEKAQVALLAQQIKSILKEHPHGIATNPYALPVRVMLLTNLLGYATTYGCKSGKDRTGVCALELESLAAKLLSTNELYDPVKPSDGDFREEKAILEALYQGGEATTIAGINTGTKKLKVKEMLGFHALHDRFGANLAKDFTGGGHVQRLNEQSQLVNEKGQRITKKGHVLPQNPPPKAPSTATQPPSSSYSTR